MKRETLDLLACPHCGGILGGQDDPPKSLVCSSCEATFPVANGVPDLVPGRAPNTEWRAWEEKQALGMVEYEQADHVGADPFDDVAAEFGAFASLRGIVLDIGCGMGDLPRYARGVQDGRYLGLDPLNGRRSHEFEFIRGVGEQLPLRDAVCDYVVSATSLDHVVEPDRVLLEARRVLKPGGLFALWIAVVDEEAILHRWWRPHFDPRGALREGGVRQLLGSLWYWSVRAPLKRLMTRIRFRLGPAQLIRDLYPDRMRFHFHFFRMHEVVELLGRCGFTVLKQRLVEDSAQGNSLFVLASRSTEAD